ncbi:MAG: AAC(3) family N-acetyltransferase [Pelolinea sp.]|nr:AAC(3) family N-acetyltransferase [Pelolinea sp.]
MISYHEITDALKSMGLQRDIPLIVHIDPSLRGSIKGGTSTLMGALLSNIDNLMLPAFTYSTMVTPEDGPENNHIDYGKSSDENLNAVIFSHTLPSEIGNQEEIDILKGFSGSYRSSHPIFSFYGLGLDIALLDHSPEKPYQPIKKLMDMGGWVGLFGAKASQNFSIHYAEYLAGRKQFLRWALTPDGIAECPHFPGCSDGFHKLQYYLQDEFREIALENTKFSAIPLSTLIKSAVALLEEDPFALLCNDLQCTCCNLVRTVIKDQIANHWKPERDND